MEIRRRRRSSPQLHDKSMLRGQEEEQEPVGNTERGQEGWNENQKGPLPDGKFRLMSTRLKSKKKKKGFGFCNKKFIRMLSWSTFSRTVGHSQILKVKSGALDEELKKKDYPFEKFGSKK